jgi:hypothetical protein
MIRQTVAVSIRAVGTVAVSIRTVGTFRPTTCLQLDQDDDVTYVLNNKVATHAN